MTGPSSSEQQDSAATCKAVVVDCPGIGKMKWCEQCAIYFGKDQPCPSSKEKNGKGATPRTDHLKARAKAHPNINWEAEALAAWAVLETTERELAAQIEGSRGVKDALLAELAKHEAAQSARPKIESWMQAHHADHKFTSLCDGCKAIQSALAATDKTASYKGQG